MRIDKSLMERVGGWAALANVALLGAVSAGALIFFRSHDLALLLWLFRLLHVVELATLLAFIGLFARLRPAGLLIAALTLICGVFSVVFLLIVAQMGAQATQSLLHRERLESAIELLLLAGILIAGGAGGLGAAVASFASGSARILNGWTYGLGLLFAVAAPIAVFTVVTMPQTLNLIVLAAMAWFAALGLDLLGVIKHKPSA